jgi:hypothetical protein
MITLTLNTLGIKMIILTAIRFILFLAQTSAILPKTDVVGDTR